MYGLLYKELITSKNQLVILLSSVLLFTVVIIFNAVQKEAYLGIVLILAMICISLVLGIVEQSIFETDETSVWQAFIVSTEDGIKNQIGSKYIFNLLLSIFVSFYLTMLFDFAGGIAEKNMNIYSTALFLWILLQLIYRAVESPFIVAFGSQYGNVIRMIVTAMISFAAIVYGLFGDLSILGSLADFLLWAEKFLTEKGSYFILLLPAFAFLLYYLSYKISCKVYLSGGKYYEK